MAHKEPLNNELLEWQIRHVKEEKEFRKELLTLMKEATGDKHLDRIQYLRTRYT